MSLGTMIAVVSVAVSVFGIGVTVIVITIRQMSQRIAESSALTVSNINMLGRRIDDTNSRITELKDDTNSRITELKRDLVKEIESLKSA